MVLASLLLAVLASLLVYIAGGIIAWVVVHLAVVVVGATTWWARRRMVVNRGTGRRQGATSESGRDRDSDSVPMGTRGATRGPLARLRTLASGAGRRSPGGGTGAGSSRPNAGQQGPNAGRPATGGRRGLAGWLSGSRQGSPSAGGRLGGPGRSAPGGRPGAQTPSPGRAAAGGWRWPSFGGGSARPAAPGRAPGSRPSPGPSGRPRTATPGGRPTAGKPGRPGQPAPGVWDRLAAVAKAAAAAAAQEEKPAAGKPTAKADPAAPPADLNSKKPATTTAAPTAPAEPGRGTAPTKGQPQMTIRFEEDSSLHRWGRNLTTVEPALGEAAERADNQAELIGGLAAAVRKLATQGETDLPADRGLISEVDSLATELGELQQAEEDLARRIRQASARAELLGGSYRRSHEVDEARLSGERGGRSKERRADVSAAERDV